MRISDWSSDVCSSDLVQHVIPDYVNCIYTRQASPRGLGHAVLCAAPIVGNEPFAVLLADDLLDADTSVTRQLVNASHEHNGSILAIQTIDPEHSRRYGIIAGDVLDACTTRVNRIVEKPEPEDRSEEHTSELQSLMRI